MLSNVKQLVSKFGRCANHRSDNTEESTPNGPKYQTIWIGQSNSSLNTNTVGKGANLETGTKDRRNYLH